MPLAKLVRDYLRRPSKNLAVVTVADVHKDYDSVFVFIEKIKEYSTETDWDTAVLGLQNDDGQGNKIVLATHPQKIREAVVSGQRIYITDTNSVQPAIQNYIVKL